jgi:aspartyl-tRNA(Asn)/glutamyl-tRNA(Gln) amidotransferase subunit A
MPALKDALPAYYVMSSAEASSNLARFDGIRYGYRAESYEDMDDLYKKSRSEGFGAEVKRRIMLGTFTLSAGYYDAYYKKALRVRALVAEDYQRILSGFDAILTPSRRRPPTGSAKKRAIGDDVHGRYRHRAREHRRTSRSVHALREGRGRPAHRHATDRRGLSGIHALPDRLRV